MIQMENVCKTFRVARRSAGMHQAFKALIHREYHKVEALKDVSFTVSDGEMVGYIGPNGAGKSSTIKVMSGILTPDSGTCLIDGRVPWKERRAHVQNIGVVFGQRSQLWWDVPVDDSFYLLRDIYHVDRSRFEKNRDELCQMLDIETILKTPTRQLSLGQRMRCEIAASLLHEPKLLFLDEPTIGLDAVSKRNVRQFVHKLNRERGTTVILTTHDMQDIEALASRILLIGKGRILLDGRLEDLKNKYTGGKKLTVFFEESEVPPIEGLTLVDTAPGKGVFCIDDEAMPVPQAITRLSERLTITDLSVESATAEELVLALYKEYAI